MKTLLAGVIGFLFLPMAMGQGTLYVGNRFPSLSVSPIYGPDPTRPTLSISGQSSIGTPTGAIVYGGTLLEGPGWTFATFAGSETVSESELPLVATHSFGSFQSGSYSGIVSVHTAHPVPGVPVLQRAKYQIRVWDNRGNTITTWSQALAAWEGGLIAAGQSTAMISGRLGGNTNGITYLPTPTVFTSFNVSFVPEPTSIAIVIVALIAWTATWRRK